MSDGDGAERPTETSGGPGEGLQRLDRKPFDPGFQGAHRALLDSLAERHLKLVPTGHPDEADRLSEVEAGRYLDPAVFAHEKRAIFDRFPIVAGLSRDIPNPGDYITVDDLDTPIVVTRTRAGTVKAFINACRHRGAALVYDKRGSGKRTFTCPYHGWTYDDQGTLYGVPCASAFEGLDKSKYGLIEVPAVEAAGVVFVSPRADAPLDLEAHLGRDLLQELGICGFDRVYGSHADSITLAGNWKLVCNTFLESYHFAVAHKNNLGAFLNSNIQTVDTFGKHIRLSTSNRDLMENYATNPPGARKPENSLVVSYFLFPGMILINSSHILQMFRIFPKSADETIIQHSCHSRMPLDVPENAERFEIVWKSAHEIVLCEDFPYGVTSAQHSLRSGSLKSFVYGKNELPIHLFHQNVADALAATP